MTKPKPPGAKKGKPGRPTGSRSRSTIERERQAILEQQRLAEAEKALAGHSTTVDKAIGSQRKLMKEIGFDLTQLAAGLAAFYQPHPSWTKDANGKLTNANPNFDEAKFRYYAAMAMAGARDFSQYESPKLSAVLVGQQIVNHVVVEGGMPDEFQPPADGDVEFKPGDIISAEDGAGAKVINGEIVPFPGKKQDGGS